MPELVRRRTWIIAAGVIALLLIAGTITVILINPKITRYVESPAFRAELEKETAKGLHFPESSFAPIKRTGFLTAQAGRFQAKDGRKAMTKIDAHGITGRFNPFGVLLRRWQIDELHIDRGVVGIHVYEPKPEPSPAKPWYHVFLPDRVYLKQVWSDPADITWRLQGQQGGIFGTHLLITPHGRDFDYRANGGTMKNAFTPDLRLSETYMLITKKVFRLYKLNLASGEGTVHVKGDAELRDAKRIDFHFDWDKLRLRDWIRTNSDGKFDGIASGHLHWTGRDFRPATTKAEGAFQVSGGTVSELKLLHELAAITRQPDFEQLELSECGAELIWNEGRGELKNIAIEDKGKFRIEGTVTFEQKSLGGEILLGIERNHLAWLPNPEEVFPRPKSGYLWTTVHLSGTWENPQQDLSPRLIEALKDRPGALLGTMLRAIGAWLRGE